MVTSCSLACCVVASNTEAPKKGQFVIPNGFLKEKDSRTIRITKMMGGLFSNDNPASKANWNWLCKEYGRCDENQWVKAASSGEFRVHSHHLKPSAWKDGKLLNVFRKDLFVPWSDVKIFFHWPRSPPKKTCAKTPFYF